MRAHVCVWPVMQGVRGQYVFDAFDQDWKGGLPSGIT